MITNYMSIKLKAVSKNESLARSVVAAFCVELNPTIDQINDIKTAVSEAVTNAIVHAYSGIEGEVEIKACIDEKTIHIEVIDEGVGIENINQAMEPFYTTKPDDERSGMGFTVMESYMDSLSVEPNNKKGLKVKMSKIIDKESKVEEK